MMPRPMRPQGHYHQGFGDNHHHMPMDASSPASCECWPTPPPYYGGCIHGNFPAYNAYWPPCYPSQVQYHPCCVNHSGWNPHAPPYYGHQPFPVGYQPWCDSERKHGCGTCSPQMCYPKNERGVVIEEHEPEIKKEEAADPVRSSNWPYPVIWFPNENVRNQEHGNSPGSRNHEVKAPENMKIQKSDPRVRNGHFPFDESTLKSLVQNQDMNKMQNGKTVEIPFDISKLKSLLQGRDGDDVEIQRKKEEQNQERQKNVELPFDISKLKSLLQGLDGKEVQIPKSKEETGQSPFPIFWMPCGGKREDNETCESKERDDKDHNMKSAPSSQYNEGQIAQYKGKEDNAEERSFVRNIPVEKHIQEPRNIPVKQSENHLPKPTEPTKNIAKTKPAENTNESTRKEQPSSPPKASRLPPVCLRVDPLPKRKNGGSKSLSPPRRKDLKAEETKVASPLSSKKAETMTVPEACDVTCEDKRKGKKIAEGSLNATGTGKDSLESHSNHQEGANGETIKSCDTKEDREKPAKKTFTEEEAARIIQSRYRGYAVRRGEPIKKLKEIATIHEQMGDVKRRMQELDGSNDHHYQEKEIVILGEVVMSLLLKLDSLQGLHPSIRDYRKSLARELSDIQDRVDSMKKSNAEKKAVEKQVEDTPQTSDCPVNVEHTQLAEENKVVHESNTDEHTLSVMRTTDKQLAAEAEEGTGLSETFAVDPEPANETSVCEALATSAVAPEKFEEVNTPSADGSTATNIEEDKVMLEKLQEPSHELPPVVNPSPGLGCEGPEDATKVSGTDVVDVSEDDRKRDDDDDNVLPAEKDVELFEQLPVGVNGDETQILSQDPSSVTSETASSGEVTSSTIIPERTVEVDAVQPINPPSSDFHGTATNIEEDKAEVEKLEEPLYELPQVVAPSPEPGLEMATEVSETEAKASENEDKKKDDDTQLPLEKEVELSELPVGVMDDETQIPLQDSSSCTSEAQTTAMDPETAIQEKKNVEHSPDHSKSLGQETSEPREEKEQSPDTEVTENEIPEDTKKLMEENQRFKETMETLVKAGKEQLEIISQLTGRVKSLEKELSQKKKRKRTQIGLRKPHRGTHTTKSTSASSTEYVL